MTLDQALQVVNQAYATGTNLPPSSQAWQVIAFASQRGDPRAAALLQEKGLVVHPGGPQNGVWFAGAAPPGGTTAAPAGTPGPGGPNQTAGTAGAGVSGAGTSGAQNVGPQVRRGTGRDAMMGEGGIAAGQPKPPMTSAEQRNRAQDSQARLETYKSSGGGQGGVAAALSGGSGMNPANPNDPGAGMGQVPEGYFLRDLGITEAGLGELDPYSNEGSAQILRLLLGNNGLMNTPLAQYLADDAQGAAILNLILGGNLLAGTPGKEPVSRSQQLMGMEDILERSYAPNAAGQYYDPSAILNMGLSQASQYPLGSGGMDDVTGGFADQADLVGYSVGAAAPYMDPLSAAHMASSFGRARQSYDDQWLMGKTQGSYIDFLRQLGMM